jgi:restriction endonuclease S subunit
MSGTVRLGKLIEKAHVKYSDYTCEQKLEAFGVSNTEGITRTQHKRSDDLSNYLVIEAGSFAYNPYRINVGSIGLTPTGTVGVVSPAYIVFKPKDGELVPDVLLDFLKSPEGLRQINKLARGTVRKALRYDDLCEIKFPAIPYAEQLRILNKNIGFKRLLDESHSQITHQQSLLTKLKQAILQEAIQGKLTADWRKANTDVEPASELLHRIQTEKDRLIAEKKIRKEKALPEITPEEIPFEIPHGWEWCRFDDLLHVRGGVTKGKKYEEKLIETPYLRVANVQRGHLDLSTVKTIAVPAAEREKYALETRDLLITEGGDPDKVGRCVIWNSEISNCIHQNHVFSTRAWSHSNISIPLIALFVNAPSTREHFLAKYKQTTNLASINKTVLRTTLLPLPPLAEQAAIVEQVECLMATYHELETETEHSRTNTDNLLQAILKEAFTA